MDKTTNLYRKRKFLNKKGYQSGAYVFADVERNESKYKNHKGKKIHYIHHYFNFKLSDCDRVISLDFDIGSNGEFKNSLHKLDVISDTLKEFRHKLIECYTEQQELKRKQKEEKKNGK